ncbi:MAG: PT domain-containing protein [Clostridia bacterium]|nr:PT domain-containing protein [Clostridia bacterium]
MKSFNSKTMRTKKRTLVSVVAVLTALVLLAGLTTIASAESGYTTWDDYGYGVRSQVDSIKGDGNSVTEGLQPGDYLSSNKFTISGKYTTLSFEGWAGYDQPIMKVGYAFNDGENVLDGTVIDVEPESHAALYGGDNVKYYNIDVPVGGITEKTKITLLAELEDETVVALNRYDLYFDTEVKVTKKKNVGITSGGTGTPVCFSDFDAVAFKIRIEDEWRLGQFTVVNAPTWDMVGAGLTARIYKWDTDYDTTVKGKVLDTCVIEDHINCTSMVVEFGYIPAGDYLIEFSDFELKIGGYDATAVAAAQKDAFKFFLDGVEEDSGYPQLKMVLYDNTNPPEITPEPATPEPTEAPTEAPTDVPTEAATDNKTDAPAATEQGGQEGGQTSEPQTTEPAGDKDDKDSKGDGVKKWIWIPIVGVCVAAAAVTGVVIAKKRKK